MDPRTGRLVARDQKEPSRGAPDAVETALLQLSERLRSAGLGRDLDELLQAKRCGDQPDANFRRVAQPIGNLVGWCEPLIAASGRSLHRPHLTLAIRASLSGYLHVQLDALALQQSRGTERASGRLTAALLQARDEDFAEVSAGDPRTERTRDTLLAGYERALALQSRLWRDKRLPQPEDEDCLMGRSRPLALPSLGLLATHGLWDRWPILTELVHHTTHAAQIFDDLADADEDLVIGKPSMLLGRLAPVPDVATLYRRLYRESGFDRETSRATRHMARAIEIARAHGMSDAAVALTRDRAHMLEASRQLWEMIASRLGAANG